MTESTSSAFTTRQAAALCELGVLGVEREGQWAAVRGPVSSVLLAALGLAGSNGVPTEELIEMIWPSPDQPATARQSLANTVLRLRKANGASFVESTRRGYRIGRLVQSDRQRFLADLEKAGELVDHAPKHALKLVDRALMRWRGEPWVGIERPVGTEADRAHLVQMHTSALRLRATALIELGRHEHAVAVLRELLANEPFDEFSRHQLVQVLTGTGQRAEAIRTIQEARRVFLERGLVIDAALVGLEQDLLSAEFMFDAEPEPLPEQHTEFVGRDRETQQIADGLRDSRLVTIHGLGGSGKTRLAIHAAVKIGEAQERGFVDLSGARSSGDVDLEFARGLGMPVNQLDGLDTEQRRDALAHAASASTALLVVDNCEHVLADARAVVSALLARPGGLRILATSRRPLEIASEYRFPIPNFTDGAELFVRRAVRHGVSIDADLHATVVADICDVVDHLPLAIEIAAAQAPYRTVHEIADELGHGITQQDAAQPEPRHKTMAGTIRWSHELLDPEVAAAFVRLGIFPTAFQRDDADAVMASGDSDGVLNALVRSSLVERAERDARSFYRLAVPVRQYCVAELERTGETADVGSALAEWLLDFTDRPYGDVWQRLSVVDEIEPRYSQAIAAIAALRAAGRTGDATRLAGRLGGVALLHGHADELIELLNELWPVCDNSEAVADALLSVALCAEAVRRNEMLGHAIRRLSALDGAAGQHRIHCHCLNSLWLMWTARMTDSNYQAANDELQLARDVKEGLESPINRAHIESWQSGLHLLAGDWHAAEASARLSLRDSAGTDIDLDATVCLCHALLHLADPESALDLATGHRDRTHNASQSNRLGIAAAIARVQCGDIDLGLSEISQILDQARHAAVKFLQDDVAVAVAYIAHLLRHDDLTRQMLGTGVAGRGPWVGHLVPKICRDLGIGLTGHYSSSAAKRLARSDHYAASARRVLNELLQRRAKDKAAIRSIQG